MERVSHAAVSVGISCCKYQPLFKFAKHLVVLLTCRKPICFIFMVITLKLARRGQWRLVDLSNREDVAKKMLRMHEIRWRSGEQSENARKGVQNIWGLL